MNDRTKGLSIILFGVLCVSPDAVLVRFLTTHGSNPWTIIFWKLFLSIPLSAGYAIYEAGGLKKLLSSISRGRWYYAAVVPVQGVIDIGFTLSFVYTSAANALLLINLNPLWCAIFGRLFLNDVLPKRTIVVLVLALGCMMIIFVPEMVVDDYDEQDGAGTSWNGNIIALCTGFLLATFLSIIRKAGSEGKSLIAGTSLGASFSTVVSAGVARGQVFPGQFWEVEMWKFWLGVIAQGLGIGIIFITMAISPRYITGAEIGLCTLLEAVLGPLFVYFAFDEIPSTWTLIGGSLLLFILAAHESRPLFEKAREQYRSMSTRFSSRMSGTITQQVESSFDISKLDVEDEEREVVESFVEEDLTKSQEAHVTCIHDCNSKSDC